MSKSRAHRRTKKQLNKKKTHKKRRIRYHGGGIHENDILSMLRFRSGINLRDKRCLDIGTRDGLNCITMANLGAREVIGIDIDDSRFHEMPSNPKVSLIKVNLLDYDDEEGFDIITCFLWNMRTYQYPEIINKIKSLLKPDGTIIIGVVDDVYKKGYYNSHTKKHLPNTGSVPELIINNFNSYREIEGTQLYIIGSDPK